MHVELEILNSNSSEREGEDGDKRTERLESREMWWISQRRRRKDQKKKLWIGVLLLSPSDSQNLRVARVRSPWQPVAQHISVFGWSAQQQLVGATLLSASGNISTVQKVMQTLY